MPSASVVAQAKLNLFLRVLARESSGYHQLETLFCRLTLGDELRVRLVPGTRSLDCDGIAMPAGGLGPVEKNLAWRAAVAFCEATGWSTGFAIEIDKRIPVGGGLGGGSADAGGVLRMLNALAPAPLSSHDLLKVAAGLGADVPFLTQDASTLALAWGRGDRLMPLPTLPSRACILFTFPHGVVTAGAYRWLTEEPAAAPGAVSYRAERFSSWSDVELLAYNEFERVVLPRHPEIRRVLEGLRRPEIRRVLPVALMSGSGATVFALAPAPADGGDASAHNLEFILSPSDDSASAIPLLETATATHVEPVRVDD